MTTDIDLLLFQRPRLVRKAPCVHLFASGGEESDVCTHCVCLCVRCGVYGRGGIKMCLEFHVQHLKDS